MGPVVGRLLFRFYRKSHGPQLVNGYRMRLSTGNAYPPLDMLAGSFESETTQLIASLVQPGSFVIDIGAHVGYYTLISAGLAGANGKVLAFEPDPTNHSLLLGNIALNGFQNITVVNKAVSDRTGAGVLFQTKLDSGRHSTYQHDIPLAGTVDIETVSLDAILNEEGNPKVDLIKIDVEGAELDVWRGMGKLLASDDAPKIIIEYHPMLLQGAGVDAVQFARQIFSEGFKVQIVDENNGLKESEESEIQELADRLLEQQISVNLFCVK